MADNKNMETQQNSVQWIFPTNQMNLKMILASGLLMPREGFGDKYYSDLLNDYPGWIPLFPNSVSRSLVEQVVAEAPHLKPVAVELDLSSLQGPAVKVPAFGSPQDIVLPDGHSDTAAILLVPAPLPITLVKKIYFESVADKKEFVSRTRSQYRNVPEAWFAKASAKKRFAGQPDRVPDRIIPRETLPGTLARAQALGGMVALLFHLANRSDMGNRYFQCLTGSVDELPDLDPILAFFPAWMRQDAALSTKSIQVKLFWSLIDDIVSNPAKDLSRDVVLETIQRAIGQLNGNEQEQNKARLQRISDDLRALRGLSDDSLDDLFDRHTRTFSRALILFFIMNKGRELLTFEHKKLVPGDQLAAAILFGAREGWIDLAVDLRHSKDFADDMAFRMASFCHQNATSGLTFTPVAQPTLPLRTMLSGFKEDRRQQKRIAAAMLDIARRQKWECIETTIRLPKGLYRLVVEQSSTRLVLDGDIKTVQANVRKDLFWDAMSQLSLPLPDALERAARKTLG